MIQLDQFARALREWREMKGLTRLDAGKLLSVSHRTIERWENGRAPSLPLLRIVSEKIARQVKKRLARLTPAA